MNSETLYSSPVATAFNCTNSVSPIHDEKMIKLQEGRCSSIICQQNGAQRPADDRITSTISTTPNDSKTDFPEMESSHSQRSLCRSDEQLPSPPQVSHTQTCLSAPSDLSLPFSNNLTTIPLHNNNNNSKNSRAPHSLQRRVHFKVKGKKSAKRTAGGENCQNRKVTDYFPIRRSSRKSNTELKCEEKKQIDDLITNGIEEGMEVQHVEGKGRAVFATRCFQKGEYVVEYHGDLLQFTDAKKREAEYAQNPATGCYMYYFQYLCKKYCVDATKETGRMGRLINHSKNGNCQTKLHDINGVPHLILVASRNIDEGEELLYDYGDRSKASIAAHPWLKY